jgi:putative acetyltransferase
MIIRSELPSDIPAIRGLNLAAFESPAEADLVDALRREADPLVSLVADDAGDDTGEVVGHIMFSPVTICSGEHGPMMGLAPMAVDPTRQRRGIGTLLVRDGLLACRAIGCVAVVVLGHPEFYRRCGFVAASRFRMGCEYDVPDDVFMAMELLPDALRDVSGTVYYHRSFADL